MGGGDGISDSLKITIGEPPLKEKGERGKEGPTTHELRISVEIFRLPASNAE